MVKAKLGFSLAELLVAVLVLALAIATSLVVFVYCLGLNSISKNLTIAINASQTKVEEIYKHNFDTVVSDYAPGEIPGSNFAVDNWGENHSGIVEVDNTNPELLMVTVSISWQEKGGRIIGEDINLDGVFDVAGEDKNGNSRLDCPAQLITLLARH